MKTFEFEVNLSGKVRIDADDLEAATQEFREQVSQEPVLITPTHDQIVVITGFTWLDGTEYIEREFPDEDEDQGEEADLG